MAVVKILKEGETNIDSTDIWRFNFYSDFPTFKIAEKGSHEISIQTGNTADAGSAYVILHELGYKPIFFAWIEYDGKSYPIYGEGDSQIKGILDEYGDETMIVVYTELDTDNLTIGVYSAPYGVQSTKSFIIRWLIMIDEF